MKKISILLVLVLAMIGTAVNVPAAGMSHIPVLSGGDASKRAPRPSMGRPDLSSERTHAGYSGDISTAERNVLMDLYNSTNGPNWDDNTGWGGDPGTECDWYGVECQDDHVVAISLWDNNLEGMLPASLGGLSQLEWLDFYDNNLSGEAPPELGGLTNLVYLDLTYNEFSGELPSTLSNLTNLEYLYIFGNRFSGEIPSWLGNLTNLISLELGENPFTGALPDSLANLNLMYLNVGGARLDPVLPEWIGDMTSLMYLYLWGIKPPPGPVPDFLANLTNLMALSLFDNQFTGSIPDWLENLPDLMYLYLNDNSLEGTIPSSLANCGLLHVLDLENNLLSGNVPSWLGDMFILCHLYLGYNQFTGSLPENLANLDLYEFSMSGNPIDPVIPEWIGDETELTCLYFGDLGIQGQIPDFLANLTNLRELDLSGNKFTGQIPAWLGDLTDMEYIYLNGNQLEGPLPEELMNLTNLVPKSDDDGSSFAWNALYTDNRELSDFLNTFEYYGDWTQTQTTPPDGVFVEPVSDSHVQVRWEPIPYTADAGGYKVYYSLAAIEADDESDVWLLYGVADDKTRGGLVVTGLAPLTSYQFRVRSFTAPHANNSNTVNSPFTEAVETMTMISTNDNYKGGCFVRPLIEK